MVQEILTADSFFDFLMDQYGNYVIQKALSVAVEPYFSEFIEKLKPDVERLRFSNEFGLKIYHRLIKQYPPLNTTGYVKPNKKKFGSGGKGPRQKRGGGFYGGAGRGNVNINISIQNANFGSQTNNTFQGVKGGYSDFGYEEGRGGRRR